MSHHLIPALEVIYVGPCGTSFLRRHSTRFNDIQRILRKGSKRFTKFCEVLQGSARLRGSHAPCAKGSTYWTKVQWSPTNQEKSDTSLSKSYVQRELLNLAAMAVWDVIWMFAPHELPDGQPSDCDILRSSQVNRKFLWSASQIAKSCKIDEFLVQSISESKHPMVQNKQQTSGLQCRQPCFLTSVQACAEQPCPCDATDLSQICPVHLHRTSTCLTYLDVLQACEFGLYHDIFYQT
jgi:hypothetical protein